MSAAAAAAVPCAAMVVLADHIRACAQCSAARELGVPGVPRLRAYCHDGLALWEEGLIENAQRAAKRAARS